MNYKFISNTRLFKGLTEKEIKLALSCLKAYTKDYKKDDVIYHSGTFVDAIGLVLSGSVNIEQDDAWGNVSILDNIGIKRVFAEAYVCAEKELLMIDVVAAEATEILFLNMNHLIETGDNSRSFYMKIVRNMLSIMAAKNLNLSRKISHTTPKSIRGRLLSYLSYQAAVQGKKEFEVPFNRQQLANYLCVDRSAMSNELGKMKKEGLLLYNKNKFSLLNQMSEL
ncbi:Crp/Fnr family transcriptional regulator [Blautia liquoris]|jgi:CRP-like cAMP-binding protein|uniref:Crp/Fnr family transcriptional regulator n=1 Tax=Blautia liquoris TaxID=2779518 RepID=A0A7M2RKI0_9FIRM|nr:Crp/Fnr family transcriptional regulator [Blautia liquoris]QOV20856.1 Crp/Fnr family transcriptional regulator [Blautia liquoris]